MLEKRHSGLHVSFLLTFAAISCAFSERAADEMSSLELVNEMAVGWNLGNTLDAWSDRISGLETETCWGVPKTTKEMFDTVKARGFKTIRIPVSWRGHFGEAPEYEIDGEWLDRVEEVVNYAFDGKTYVIVNSHHDEWVTLTADTKTEVKDKICRIWVQIAERFKNYDYHLIFETLNEPRLYGTPQEWTGGTAEARSILNEYNDAIVKAIRSSGGNNAIRHIMIPTYCASSLAEAQNGLVIPSDDPRIIVSQHIYFPYYFTMDMSPSTSTDKWGSEKDKNALTTEFDRVYETFIKKGIAVVIGEWGCINKSNEDARVAHAKFYMAEARKRGICAIWWDNNLSRSGEQTFGLLDRATCTWKHPRIVDAIMEGAGVSGNLIYRSSRIEPPSDGGSISSGFTFITLGLTCRNHSNLFDIANLFDLKGRKSFPVYGMVYTKGSRSNDLFHVVPPACRVIAPPSRR